MQEMCLIKNRQTTTFVSFSIVFFISFIGLCKSTFPQATTHKPVNSLHKHLSTITNSPLLDQSLQLECIEGLTSIFAIRNFSVFKRFFQLLKDHAPLTERLQSAFQTIYEHKSDSLKLWQFRSQGINLNKGIYYLINNQQRARLAIAYKPKQAQAALRETQSLLGVFVKLQQNKIDIMPEIWEKQQETPSHVMQCKRSNYGRWILCDESNVRSAPAPQWLTADQVQGSFWGYIYRPIWLNLWFIFQQASFTFSFDIQGEEMSAHAEIIEPFNPMFSIFSPNKLATITSLTSWIDEVTPAFLKLSIQPEVLKLYPLQVMNHRLLDLFLQWYQAGWNGDLLLTFDGSLDHPILLVGTQAHPWAQEKLLASWSESLGMQPHFDLDANYGTWNISQKDQTLTIPIGLQHEVIILGLFPTDVKRRLKDTFKRQPNTFFDLYERKGVSSLFFDPLLLNLTDARINLDVLQIVSKEVLTGYAQDLVDLPIVYPSKNTSLANVLVNQSQLSLTWVTDLLQEYIKDASLLIAFSDLMSLWVQLSEGIYVSASAYMQDQTYLSIDVRWRSL